MSAGALRGLDEEGQVEGAGGEGEAGDTAAPRAPLEVAADAVEGVGVFEVREEVADEGKDHAKYEFIRLRGGLAVENLFRCCSSNNAESMCERRVPHA